MRLAGVASRPAVEEKGGAMQQKRRDRKRGEKDRNRGGTGRYIGCGGVRLLEGVGHGSMM